MADFARQHGDVLMLIPILEEATKANDPRAFFELGLIYENGSEPFMSRAGLVTDQKIEPDPDKAVEYYKKASDLGHVEANYSLALMIFRGSGIRQNIDVAMQYYERGAALGDVRAQNDLGTFFLEGSYVTQNVPLGMEWIRKSATAGYPLAELNLAAIYGGFAHGNVDLPVDHGTALTWALVAARWFPGANKETISEAEKVAESLQESLDPAELHKATDEADTIKHGLLVNRASSKQ